MLETLKKNAFIVPLILFDIYILRCFLRNLPSNAGMPWVVIGDHFIVNLKP